MNTLWSAQIYFPSDGATTPELVKAEKNGEKIEFLIPAWVDQSNVPKSLQDVLVPNYTELEIVSFSDVINTDRSFLLTLLSKYDDGKPSSVDYFAAVKQNEKTVPKRIVSKTARVEFSMPTKDDCKATVPDRYKVIFEEKIDSILGSTDHKTEFLLSFVRHLKNDSREHTNANYTIWSKLLSEPGNGAEILFEKPGRFIVLNVALTNEFLIVNDAAHKYITKILFRNNEYTTPKHSKVDWTINPYGTNPRVYSRYLPPIDYFKNVYVKMISKDDDKSKALFPYDIATAKVKPIAKPFKSFDMDSVQRILKNIVHYNYLAEPWTIMCVWMPSFKKIELVEIDNGLRKKTCIVSQETSLLLSKDENIRVRLSPGLVNFAMFIRNICALVHEAKRAVMHEIQKYAEIGIIYRYSSIESSTAFSAYTMNQDINELNIQSMHKKGFMVDDVDLRAQLSQNHSGSPPVINLKEKRRVLILDLSHMQDPFSLLLQHLEPHTIDVLVSDNYYYKNRNVYSLMIPYSAYYDASNKRHEHLKIEEIIVSVVEGKTRVLRFSSATIQVNSEHLKRFLAIVAKLHEDNPNFVQNGDFDDVMKQLTNNELFSEHDEMPLVAAEKTSYSKSRISGTLPHGRTVLDTDSHASSASSLSSTVPHPHASTFSDSTVSDSDSTASTFSDSTLTDDSTVSKSDSTVSDATVSDATVSDATESVSTESESVSTVSASDKLTASDYVSESAPRTTEASSQNLATTPRFVRKIRDATVKDAIHRLLHGRSRSKSRKW
jgi:hypothetical protein